MRQDLIRTKSNGKFLFHKRSFFANKKGCLGGFYFINEDSLQIKNGDFIFLVGEIFFPS